MRRMLQAVSAIALAATLLPSSLFLAGTLELDYAKWTMLAATLAWFAATPLWMDRAQEKHGPAPFRRKEAGPGEQ